MRATSTKPVAYRRHLLVGGRRFIRPWAPAGRITAISRTTTGLVHLEEYLAPNQHVPFQASTNLIDWLNIGTITAAADGSFGFPTPMDQAFTQRFYRLSLR